MINQDIINTVLSYGLTLGLLVLGLGTYREITNKGDGFGFVKIGMLVIILALMGLIMWAD